MAEPVGRFGTITWFTQDGGERLWPIESPSTMVGRADTNDLVLDDFTVSRRHARLTIENGRLMVEDLGSSTGTFIDGHPIPPHTPSLVDSGQEIRFGGIVARYTEPAAVVAEEEEEEVTEEGAPMLPPDLAAPVRVTLIPPATPAVPGGGAVVARVLIHNAGRVVDQVSVNVLDLPPEWVRITTPQAVLVPGESAEVSIAFSVPRRPDATAGTYEFNVVVTSTETQREVFTTASLVVPPFYDTLFELRPKRSKRNFTLFTENRGNAFITYDLFGRDDEDAFEYDFQPPAIPLQPGESQRTRVRVKGPRRLFGRQEMYNFAIVGRSTADPAVLSEATGQLLSKPPLQRLVLPATLVIALAIGIVAALIYYFWPVWPFEEGGSAEAAANLVAVVHPMCDPEGSKTPEPAPQPKPPDEQRPGTFFQNDVAWADDEYARAKDPDFGPDWCGDTVAQCGCAMTSVANVMTLLGIVTMAQGTNLNPRTLNDWLNLDAQRKSRGWVSRGYVYGDVVWTAANQLSAEIHERFPNQPTIAFAGFGTGTDEDLKSELRAGRPVIFQVPGHFLAAVGIDENDEIIIHDPFYPERTRLSFYRERGVPVLKSVKFKVTDDLSGVLITAPQDVRIKVTRKDTGEEVGTLSTAPPEEAAQRARVEVPGASYSTHQAWRDPTCTEREPAPGVGVNQIFLPGTIDDYVVQYLNTTADAPSVVILSYDEDGQVEIIVEESPPSNLPQSFDSAPPETPTPEPTSTPTPVTAPPATPTPVQTAPVATATPTPPATATATTAAEGTTPTPTPTPTEEPPPPAPRAGAISCGTAYQAEPRLATVTCNGQVTGAFTATQWSLNGVPSPETGLVLTATFTTDTTLTVKLRACNQVPLACNEATAAVIVKFPEAPTPSPATVTPTPTETAGAGETGAVSNLDFTCDLVYTPLPTLSCQTSFSGSHTSVRWEAPGTCTPVQTSFSTTYTTLVPPDGVLCASGSAQVASASAASAATLSVRATVCNGGACVSRTHSIVAESRMVIPAGRSATFYAVLGACNDLEYGYDPSDEPLGSKPFGCFEVTLDPVTVGPFPADIAFRLWLRDWRCFALFYADGNHGRAVMTPTGYVIDITDGGGDCEVVDTPRPPPSGENGNLHVVIVIS